MTVGFDPEYSRFSVGSVLYGLDIEQAIRESFMEYDLSRGAEGYKQRWGAEYTANMGILVSKNRRILDESAQSERISCTNSDILRLPCSLERLPHAYSFRPSTSRRCRDMGRRHYPEAYAQR